MKITKKKWKRNEIKHKQEKKGSLHKVIFYEDYVMVLSKAKTLYLNSKKRIKWLIMSLLGFQYSLYLLYS